MPEESTPYTSEYMLKETEAALAEAHDRNASLYGQIRAIKSTRWYRLGKFLRLIP